MIEVTQADREAAAKWAKMQGRPQQAANMRRGSCDSAPLVQAFARHRIAALEEAATELDRQDGYGEWSEAAAAIRALKGPNNAD